MSPHAARIIDASTNLIWWLPASRIPGSWNELATEVRTQRALWSRITEHL
jgi:hypothetical protein